MNKIAFINKKVHKFYWQDDLNCATTTLKMFSLIFEIELDSQVINSAIGLHGAGEYGAQCGLVEGTLMFIGIRGHKINLSKEQIIKQCYFFAKKFEKEFGSLLCRELRPQGFSKDNPPHLCENITKKAILFSTEFIEKFIKNIKS